MELPLGYNNNSLYGLKQVWNTRVYCVFIALSDARYKQSKVYYLLFIQLQESSLIVILVCVNDVILVGKDVKKVQKLKRFLNDWFKLKDLGNLKYLLGI